MSLTPNRPDRQEDGPHQEADGDVSRPRERLRNETEFTSAVLDTVGALVVVLDNQGRIVLFNQTCSQVTGYTYEEVEGRQFWEVLLLPDEVESVSRVFDELRAGTFPNKHVNFWVAKDGGRHLISWSNTAVFGDNGSIEYVIGTGIDITERDALERELRQSQKMEAVGRLAGGVAHDFGSVLTAITGYAARALGQLERDHPARKALPGVLRASERAADLIRRLLIFSRRQALEPKTLKLNIVVANMSAMLRRVIGEDIELINHLDADRGQIRADRSQMEQVLLNLAVNARDAMPRGGTLTIETSDVELSEQEAQLHGDVAPGPYVLLTVRDTGKGIDQHTLSLVFEPFFTTKEEGTGLGLSTVYGIVKKSDGHIWVESKPYLGTSFKVYLPRDEGRVEDEPAESGAESAHSGWETILLVEDDEDVRIVATRTLVEAGYTVLDAAGPEEALRLCDQHPAQIHLILSDVVLPRMSGTKLARILTSIRLGTKVLFMSGYTGAAGEERGALHPEDNFMEKPFTPHVLAKRVREVLDGA
jgi:PAS domain S-box-containing protein